MTTSSAKPSVAFAIPSHPLSSSSSFYSHDIRTVSVRKHSKGSYSALNHRRNRRTIFSCETNNEHQREQKIETKSAEYKYQIEILKSITEMESIEWNTFAKSGCKSPFLLHDWIKCLEQSNCASPVKGWSPTHFIIRQCDANRNVPIAIIPGYLKSHSMGEFVFDHEWADAAYAAGINYYPKLLLGIPFTPATGRRILTLDESNNDRKDILSVVAGMLVHVCQKLNISSVHANFCTDDEVDALKVVGFLHRKGIQYHFTNYKKSDSKDHNNNWKKIAYDNFDDYLSEFKSKKRIKMKRERKVVCEESNLKLEIFQGEQITEQLLLKMYAIYKSTIDKLLYGRQYLTEQFFQQLNECNDFKQHICLILAKREDNDEIIGGTFNVIGNNIFYGRYWGCIEDYRYLHFEACYYSAIEHCINNGYERMEPGAGGGDFKYMRGFEPCVTNSMHFLLDPRLSHAVKRYLMVEGTHVQGAVDEMQDGSAIRSKATPSSPLF